MANEKTINLALLEYFRQLYDKRLKDGTLVVSKSLSAKALENISEESGTVQETPFIIQGTGTANNTELVDTSPIGKQLEKQGNTVVKNQKVSNYNFASNTGIEVLEISYLSSAVSNNKLTLTVIQPFSSGVDTRINCDATILGHKNLLIAKVKSTVGNNQVRLKNDRDSVGTFGTTVTINQGETKLIYALGEDDASHNAVRVRFVGPADVDAQIEVYNVYAIDLTQWFGSNDQIPQDLLDNPSHWSWYQNYGDYIPYNTGELVNCAGRYLNCGGRNQCDEVFESGTYNANTGLPEADGGAFRTKNKSIALSNISYCLHTSDSLDADGYYVFEYDKQENFIRRQAFYDNNQVFTTSPNCAFLHFGFWKSNSGWGTTNLPTKEQAQITISLYYTTGDSYNEYFPYVAPKVYDTGVEVLRKAGSVKDYKTPDGTVHRVIGSYTFTGEETWSIGSGYAYIALLGAKRNVSYLLNDLGLRFDMASGSDNLIIYVDTSVYDTSAKLNALTSGGTVLYELATETTESGTPFSENIEIDDYGDMSWKDTNEDYVAIPQGVKLFYPADYALLIDTLNSYVNGDITKLAKKTDLSEYVKQEDLSDGITVGSNITFTAKNLIKQGKVVTLSARLSTTGTISGGTAFFTLPNGAYNPSYAIRLSCYTIDSSNNHSLKNFAIGVDGAFSCNNTISSGETVWIQITYIVN